MLVRSILMVLVVSGATWAAEDEPMRMLITFDEADSAKQWQSVNDGVMGGRSDGDFKMTEDGTMQFVGNLSLENNGGFASVRSRPIEAKLKSEDVLVARVRGDGREYSFNLYVPRRLAAFSYRLNFTTKPGEWMEVELPLEKFVATSFGQVIPDLELKPMEVNAVGILLGDKKAGPFKLEVDWIKVRSGAGS